MTANDLYHELIVQGFCLSVNGASLTLSPSSLLTDELRAQIRKNKAELMALVASNDHDEPTAKAQPYTAIELLTHYEKPLFNHLLACPYCHVEKAQYCASGYAMGSVYDALLLNREDAQARRESLALRVDRACISGRSVFEAFNPANVQQSPIAEPR